MAIADAEVLPNDEVRRCRHNVDRHRTCGFDVRQIVERSKHEWPLVDGLRNDGQFLALVAAYERDCRVVVNGQLQSHDRPVAKRTAVESFGASGPMTRVLGVVLTDLASAATKPACAAGSSLGSSAVGAGSARRRSSSLRLRHE